ncbi:MAG: adenylate/guanylate cyclase domain-containing protein, partial [Rhodospirillales bacterium]|nr:adenylate/guanylate cyclase domain-containing protein [Rhodospirillales bacterium]
MQKLSAFIFGTPIGDHLPERIAKAIARQQMESEKLIGWVQLILAIVFGSLWAVSPPPPYEVNFQPVPWAVGFYAVFTLVRLIGAYKGYLPNWLLMISVVMDMGLLMILIWSFHIQYMQPPSFYLKAPTFMYVFIFIALRALRFEPKYIFVAGITAVTGWAVLMMYVMLSVPEDMMITRNYVTYLTSNSILIGAEIDKILSIVLVTVVLGTATLRAQRAFMRAVLQKTAADDLSRFISPEIAKRITESDRTIQPGDGELRHATVMFTDIEGFSTASEKMSPQELAKTLNEYFRVMHEVLERFGGVITQFQGDA